MAIEGKIEETPLSDVWTRLGGERSTGILTVQGEAEVIAITFLHGEIVAADALNRSLDEGLAAIFAQENLVPSDKLAALVAEQETDDGRLLDLLVERNYLDRDRLLECLRQHNYRILLEALAWSTGGFKFYAGEEVSFEEGVGPLTVAEVLVRATQELGERGPLAGRLPDSTAVFEKSEQFSAAQSDLRQAELEFLEHLTHSRTAQQLTRELELPEHVVLFHLVRLQSAGAAHSPQSAVGATGPSPAAGQEAPEAKPESTAEMPQGGEAEGLLSLGDVEEAPGEEPAPAASPKGRGAAKSSAAKAKSARGDRRTLEVRLAELCGLGVLAALVMVVVGLAGRQVFFPFPWLRESGQAFEEAQRRSLFKKIERASRTHFLLQGEFPADLEVLADNGLLGSSDRRDPSGLPLSYTAKDLNYVVAVTDPGQDSPVAAETVAVAGDFLLDPSFLLGSDPGTRSPLVLLD